MGFAWNNFGILTHESEDEKYLYIHNDKDGIRDKNHCRKISKAKYSSTLPNLRKKIQTLIGKPVIFRTSQNTANWTTSEWFSDIDIDESGFQNPEAIKPFSEPNYSEENEPEPGSSEILPKRIAKLEKAHSEKIAKLEKAHSDEKEEWKEKENSLIDNSTKLELANATLNAQLREEREELPDDKKRKIEADASKLLDMKLIDTKQFLKVRGHPDRQMSLRLGEILPKGQHIIRVKFVSHKEANNYHVSLPDFNDVNAIASVGLDTSDNMYVASFRNMDPDYFNKFKKIIGADEASYKDRDMTPEARIKIYNKVMSVTPT